MLRLNSEFGFGLNDRYVLAVTELESKEDDEQTFDVYTKVLVTDGEGGRYELKAEKSLTFTSETFEDLYNTVDKVVQAAIREATTIKKLLNADN